MEYETRAILRAILFTAMRAKSLDELRAFVESMCQKDDVDSVEAALNRLNEIERQ